MGVVSGASALTALHVYTDAGGFVAGYRFAFFAAGGGLLAALALSCLWWPRAWFTSVLEAETLSRRECRPE